MSLVLCPSLWEVEAWTSSPTRLAGTCRVTCFEPRATLCYRVSLSQAPGVRLSSSALHACQPFLTQPHSCIRFLVTSADYFPVQ